MNNRFDELAKGLAQSGTRRQALKKFGIGLAGMALACFGLASVAEAKPTCIQAGGICDKPAGQNKCCAGLYCQRGSGPFLTSICVPL